MNRYLVEGSIAVKACLEGNNREVYEVIIADNKKDKNTKYIMSCASKRNVLVTIKSRDEIDSLVTGKTSGGIIAYVGETRYSSSINDINSDLICLLEGVEDPYNYASSLRTLYASGFKSILVQERNWFSAVSVIVKSSAGASEFINIVKVQDNFISQLKEKGYQIVISARANDATSVFTSDFNNKVCLIIGGEKRGISNSVMSQADKTVYIPYGSNFRNSLSAADSTAILSFAIASKLNKLKGE